MITTPCDLQALPCVKQLLEFLNSIEGKHILTGQHTQSVPMEEAEHIYAVTGKYPAVCGFELLGYSPNICRETASEECLKEVDDAYGTVECALEWARKGGIVTYTWHWFSPLGGKDKSFFSVNTDFDAEKALETGTEENLAMIHDLDVMAEILRRFQNENIPILWRPFHEAEGSWFWWGAKGVRIAAKLFRFMFHYFTKEKNIHNLVWVWNSPKPEGYVGDEYCDIVTRDLYPEVHNHTDLAKEYEELHRVTDANKGMAVAELGVIPSAKALEQSRIPWLWYMTWSHEFCLTENFTTNEALKEMYHSSYALTLEDVKKTLQ